MPDGPRFSFDTNRTGMTNHPGGSDPHDHPDHPDRIVLVRGPIPQAWADRLDHLAVDLRASRPQLITEGVLLLLRFHQRAVGLPEPIPPLRAGEDLPTPESPVSTHDQSGGTR